MLAVYITGPFYDPVIRKRSACLSAGDTGESGAARGSVENLQTAVLCSKSELNVRCMFVTRGTVTAVS
jgi:hypothetical protein